MEQIVFKEEDLKLEKIFKRFIEYVESEVLPETTVGEKPLSVSDFKKNKEILIKEGYERIIDTTICGAIFEMIAAKIKLLTLVDITNDSIQLEFKELFNFFKNSVILCEQRFAIEGKNLYDLSQMDIADIISNNAAGKIVQEIILPSLSQ